MQRNFTSTISILVMIILKGWRIIVNLTFAFLRRTMMVDCNLFQNLSDLEAMGTVTTIYVEKIDTLIAHEMSVTKFYFREEFV